MSAPIVIVSGALANKPGNGGGVWERMSWAVGLRRLGCDVYFVEQIQSNRCADAHGHSTSFDISENLAWFREMTDRFGFANRSALLCDDGKQSHGLDLAELTAIADAAQLLVNLSGHLNLEPLCKRIAQRAYVDVDPGFTQLWHADPNTDFQLRDHDAYFTIGENIGTSACSIPTGGIPWQNVRQPVLFDQWTDAPSRSLERFTTIASWRGPFGSVVVDGKAYGMKVHQFRKFVELPTATKQQFEIALDIDPADWRDREALEQHGWWLSDPQKLADPYTFQQFIQQSDAEFSVAQGVYVDTNSGWFSERSARYLASGKPVLVQETGFSRHLPTGTGLLSFSRFEEAVQGCQRIAAEYAAHAQAARDIAEQYFDSDVVLSQFLNQLEMKSVAA